MSAKDKNSSMMCLQERNCQDVHPRSPEQTPETSCPGRGKKSRNRMNHRRIEKDGVYPGRQNEGDSEVPTLTRQSHGDGCLRARNMGEEA